jgi:hypothetical protein
MWLALDEGDGTMGYLQQMLEDLQNGSQLIIRCRRNDTGISFEAFVIDTKGAGYIEVERSTLDLAMGALDELADEWLRSKEQAL